MPDYYGTVEAADAYHSARGNSSWASASPDLKLASIIVASEWLDYKYGSQFPAYKTGMRDQIREWPRTGVVDWYGYPIGPNEIPREVENATYEVALRNSRNPGALNIDVVLAKTYKAVTIQGAVAVQYAGAMSPEDMELVIPIIGRILQPIMTLINSNISSLCGSAVRG